MSGLEAVEVSLDTAKNNKDFRIDTAFYTVNLKKNESLKYDKIRDCLVQSQYGISIEMNEDSIGYPIYRMNEIHNMLCDLYVDKSACISPAKFEMYKLNAGDVLFNRTNSFEFVGRAGVYYPNAEQAPMTFASYLVRFVPDITKINSEYLTAFLSCKYGVLDIKRRARQSVNQTNVNPEEVKEIEIPLVCAPLQSKIKQCFQSAHLLRLEADRRYRTAESLITEELDIKNISPAKKSVAIKLLSESFGTIGRLDAEYYQPKYEKLENAIISRNTTQVSVNDGFFIPRKGEYNYIELANIGMSGNITGHTTASFHELPSRARRMVKSGQVIVSSVEGSLQSCALITDNYDGAICSTGFHIIESPAFNPETLLILFKSAPIQAMMERRCTGTILPAISKANLEEMPLPTVKNEIQQQIANAVQNSLALRNKSEQLLESAKQAVELAIEKNENTAISFLESQQI